MSNGAGTALDSSWIASSREDYALAHYAPAASNIYPPLHVELQRRIKRSGTAVLVPEYHNQRPLGTVSKVTIRSLQRKWAVQKQAEAAARQEEENNREAVAAEKLRLQQQKADIRRRAIEEREVPLRARVHFAHVLLTRSFGAVLKVDLWLCDCIVR
eukprot:COSAG02_NODE_4191_length_5645_cov_5.454922_5_plen_157_part_00